MVLSIFSTDQTPGIDKSEKGLMIHGRFSSLVMAVSASKSHFQFAPLTLALVPRSDPLVERAIKRNSTLGSWVILGGRLLSVIKDWRQERFPEHRKRMLMFDVEGYRSRFQKAGALMP